MTDNPDPRTPIVNTNIQRENNQEGAVTRTLKNWLRSLTRNKTHSLEESVVELIEEHDENGSKIGDEERILLHNLLHFGDLIVDDIKIPRTDIVAVSHDISLEDLQKTFIEEAHTRMPVYKESLDNIIGFIHIKDFLPFISRDKNKEKNAEQGFDLVNVIRTSLIISPSMKLIDLLAKMRGSSIHMAIVIDEYGGTDGLVTIEDLVEEIVGEIKDEHDQIEEKNYLLIDENTIEANGRLTIEELEEIIDEKILETKSEDFDTVGGLILSHVGYIPSKGEIIKHSSTIEFEIMDVDPRRVKKLLIRKLTAEVV